MASEGVISAASAMQPAMAVRPELAVRAVKNEIKEEKELVAQIMTAPQQVASQIYDSHGQIVPTPAGSGVDLTA